MFPTSLCKKGTQKTSRRTLKPRSALTIKEESFWSSVVERKLKQFHNNTDQSKPRPEDHHLTKTLHLTLKLTTTQVVSVTYSRLSKDYSHMDNHTRWSTAAAAITTTTTTTYYYYYCCCCCCYYYCYYCYYLLPSKLRDAQSLNVFKKSLKRLLEKWCKM